MVEFPKQAPVLILMMLWCSYLPISITWNAHLMLRCSCNVLQNVTNKSRHFSYTTALGMIILITA